MSKKLKAVFVFIATVLGYACGVYFGLEAMYTLVGPVGIHLTCIGVAISLASKSIWRYSQLTKSITYCATPTKGTYDLASVRLTWPNFNDGFGVFRYKYVLSYAVNKQNYKRKTCWVYTKAPAEFKYDTDRPRHCIAFGNTKPSLSRITCSLFCELLSECVLGIVLANVILHTVVIE